MRISIRRAVVVGMASVSLLGGGIHFARVSHANPAFLPLIIGVEVIGLMGVGAAIEMYDGAPTPAAAVGARALSVTIVNSADSGAAGGAVRVPTTAGVDSAASIPAPTAATTAAATQATEYQGSSVSSWHSSVSAACADYAAFQDASWIQGTVSVTGVSGGTCNLNFHHTNNNTDTPDTYVPSTRVVDGCPAGYSGAPCTLVNARAATNDGKQDLARSGTTLSKMPDDASGAVNAVLSTKYLSNDTADVSGISVSGQPRKVSVTAVASGGSEIVQITQKQDGAGQTYLEQRTYTVDATGTITNATQSAVPGTMTATGSGSGAGSTSSYSVTTGTGTFTPAAAGSGSGVAGSGTGATDYARQGEAGTAAASIVGALTGPSITAPDQTVLDARKTAMEGLCSGAACAENSVLNPGSSWMPSFLPGNAPACAPIEFRGAINVGPASGLDSTTSLDVCWALDIGRGVFGWLLNIFAIIYIWRRFTNMYNA